MKIHTFVIGSVLALALFLFAKQRPEANQPGSFREVVDLTHSLPTSAESKANSAYQLQNVPMSGFFTICTTVSHPNRCAGANGSRNVDS